MWLLLIFQFFPLCFASFFPDNNLHLSASSFNSTSQEDFNNTIELVEAVYTPIFVSIGSKLEVEKLWEDNRVNATAIQEGNVWKVRMFGGLARNTHTTLDALTLVMCHEIGHHLGGAPLKSTTSDWASVEGQADYFASLKCVRRVWQNDNNQEIIKNAKLPKGLKEKCQQNWQSIMAYALCIRTGLASYSIGKLLASLNRHQVTPSFSKTDSTIVSTTTQSHPSAQCRLDTFLQGSICSVSYLENVDQNSEITGTCHESLGFELGLRPKCWFKNYTAMYFLQSSY